MVYYTGNKKIMVNLAMEKIMVCFIMDILSINVIMDISSQFFNDLFDNGHIQLILCPQHAYSN